jgi:hypothetical protein
MNIRRLTVHALLLLWIVVGVSACQTAFPRACLQDKNCERHPVNGPSALGAVNGPSALGAANEPWMRGEAEAPR